MDTIFDGLRFPSSFISLNCYKLISFSLFLCLSLPSQSSSFLSLLLIHEEEREETLVIQKRLFLFNKKSVG